MHKYTEKVDQSNVKYWLELEEQYRYLSEEPFNRGSLGLIENVPYPLLESLKKEELMEVVRNLKIRGEELTKEVQGLTREIINLKKEIGLIKGIKKVLVTEETLIKEWDNEDDARWDSC